MNIKNVASVLLALALSFVSFSAMALNSYPQLVNAKSGSWYTEAINYGDVFQAKNTETTQEALKSYFEMGDPLKIVTGDNLDILTKNNGVYKALSKTSGEMCAMLWRYAKKKSPKISYQSKSLNGGDDEQTPFYDEDSMYFNKDFILSERSGGIDTEVTVQRGSMYEKNDYRYPIHTLGPIMGNGKGLSKKLAFTVMLKFYRVRDDFRDGNLTNVNGYVPLVILPGYSLPEIYDMSSERDAYNSCSENALLPIQY